MFHSEKEKSHTSQDFRQNNHKVIALGVEQNQPGKLSAKYIYLIKDLSPEYIKNLINSIRRKTTIFLMGKRFGYFIKEDRLLYENKHNEKVFSILSS